MKPCCESMAAHVDSTALRGFSVHLPKEGDSGNTRIIVNKLDRLDDMLPYIQFRAFDDADEGKVEVASEAGVVVSISGQIGFRFCPWCGRRLITVHAPLRRWFGRTNG